MGMQFGKIGPPQASIPECVTPETLWLRAVDEAQKQMRIAEWIHQTLPQQSKGTAASGEPGGKVSPPSELAPKENDVPPSEEVGNSKACPTHSAEEGQDFSSGDSSAIDGIHASETPCESFGHADAEGVFGKAVSEIRLDHSKQFSASRKQSFDGNKGKVATAVSEHKSANSEQDELDSMAEEGTKDGALQVGYMETTLGGTGDSPSQPLGLGSIALDAEMPGGNPSKLSPVQGNLNASHTASLAKNELLPESTSSNSDELPEGGTHGAISTAEIVNNDTDIQKALLSKFRPFFWGASSRKGLVNIRGSRVGRESVVQGSINQAEVNSSTFGNGELTRFPVPVESNQASSPLETITRLNGVLPGENNASFLAARPGPPSGQSSTAAQPTDANGLPRVESGTSVNPRTSTPETSGHSTAEGTNDRINVADRVRFIQRVARAFSALGGQGQVLRLRLHPPALGSLKLELTMKTGVLTARLETESAEIRQLLLENVGQLRDRLAEYQIRVERFEVDLANPQQGDPSRNFDQPRRPPGIIPNHSERKAPEAVSAPTNQRLSRAPILESNRVDLWI